MEDIVLAAPSSLGTVVVYYSLFKIKAHFRNIGAPILAFAFQQSFPEL